MPSSVAFCVLSLLIMCIYAPTIVFSMNMTRQSEGLLMINREGVLLYTESTSKRQKLAVSGIVLQMILIWAQIYPLLLECKAHCVAERFHWAAQLPLE